MVADQVRVKYFRVVVYFVDIRLDVGRHEAKRKSMLVVDT